MSADQCIYRIRLTANMRMDTKCGRTSCRASRPPVWSARFGGRLIGSPIPSDQEHVERLGVATGLPVFASDNISSSAYATEEIMRVLVLAGVGALALTLPITFVIVAVLAIVVISYQQTIAGLSHRWRLVHRGQATTWARWPL